MDEVEAEKLKGRADGGNGRVGLPGRTLTDLEGEMRMISEFNDDSVAGCVSLAIHSQFVPLGTNGSAWQSNPTGNKWIGPAVQPHRRQVDQPDSPAPLHLREIERYRSCRATSRSAFQERLPKVNHIARRALM